MCNVSLAEDGTAPEWVMLVPAGDINGLDGRNFKNPDPQAVVDVFNANSVDLPIDWEHAQHHKAEVGERAPAAGWIKAMEVRDGAIWGQVEWTDAGRADIETKAYRYLSPGMFVDTMKRLVELVSAGLVNRPALDMPALAQAEPEPLKEKLMTREQLIAFLGLAAEATDDQIKTAMDAMKAKSGDAEAAEQLVEETQKELENARAASPSLDKYVPRLDHDAALARAKSAEAQLAQRDTADHDKAVEVAIVAAMKAGKITPATKDFYVANCSTKEGLERFEAFAKDAPPIAASSNLDVKDPPSGENTKPTENDLTIARNCGLTVEQFMAAKKAG